MFRRDENIALFCREYRAKFVFSSILIIIQEIALGRKIFQIYCHLKEKTTTSKIDSLSLCFGGCSNK